jgi:hypothetical protein
MNLGIFIAQDLPLSPPSSANDSSIHAKQRGLLSLSAGKHGKFGCLGLEMAVYRRCLTGDPPGQIKCEQSSSDGGRANPLVFNLLLACHV